MDIKPSVVELFQLFSLLKDEDKILFLRETQQSNLTSIEENMKNSALNLHETIEAIQIFCGILNGNHKINDHSIRLISKIIKDKPTKKENQIRRQEIFERENSKNPDSVKKIDLFSKGKIVDFTLIDFEDKDLLNYRYHINPGGYAMRSKHNKGNTILHIEIASRFIYEKIENADIIDHKNRDYLDNRRTNLRKVSGSENARNISSPSHNTSTKMGFDINKGSYRYRTKKKNQTISAYDKDKEVFIEKMKILIKNFDLPLDICDVILWVENSTKNNNDFNQSYFLKSILEFLVQN